MLDFSKQGGPPAAFLAARRYVQQGEFYRLASSRLCDGKAAAGGPCPIL